MKKISVLLTFCIALVFMGSAFAVMPGKTVEYAGGDAGKVVFNGDTHGPKQGMKCADCHPKPFGMKKGDFTMSREDHGKPDYCGKCHDGQQAFSQSTEADCGKCHMKAEAPKAEEMKPEEIKSDEMKPEGMKPEEAPPAESK
ncbi:MAG: c(7)-type cytochrome triheme domain-containing protein [Nitrospirota bacterium]